MRQQATRRWAPIALMLGTIIVCLAVGEVVARWALPTKTRAGHDYRWHEVCEPCPEVFRLKRSLPFVDEHGNRVNPLQGDGTSGTVLFLGDSVTFGFGVGPAGTFVARLNAMMPKVRMHNAGINGYTTYNEVAYYKHEGYALKPDVVVLDVCLNDIVNPRLHWGLDNVPAGAIPNPMRDLLVARPVRASALAHLVYDVVRGFMMERYPPTHLSGISTIGVEAWSNRRSPEHQWFKNRLMELRAATEQHGSKLLVAIFPLAFQMDASYPYRPQDAIIETCREIGIQCVDLTPPLQARASEGVFLGRAPNGTGKDVWHLSRIGHQVVADALLPVLEKACGGWCGMSRATLKR